jgi:N utilization substance protein A
MSTNFKNTEILHVIDAISREKAIQSEDLFTALEEVIKSTARAQYGQFIEMEVVLDKKTGNINLYRTMEVLSDEDYEATSEERPKFISLTEAQKVNPEIAIGEKISSELPPLDMSRMTAYTAKGLIITKLRELEINRQYNQLIDKVGEIVQGVVMSLDKKGATLSIDRVEAYISRSHMIKGDNYRQGDRIKVYLVKVEKTPYDLIMHLSRTHNEFLAKLLYNEVPEIQDGLIEVKGVMRDPGSRAKLAVYSPDRMIDPVGSCIGIKGSRIQGVISELSGERIDVIRWHPDLEQYLVNCFLPVQVLKVLIDEENNKAEIQVMDKDLSSVIGRQGQNIKLISKLANLQINVYSQSHFNNLEELDESEDEVTKLINALDIDELLAQLLISEGLFSPEDIMRAGEDRISEIEGLDEAIASELVLRAKESLEERPSFISLPSSHATRKPSQEDDTISLMNEIRKTLHHAGITNLQALADMSVDELQGLLAEANVTVPRSKLEEIISDLREKLFFHLAAK